VVGFQSKADAEQFRAKLTERMRKFNLELHPEKTRLLEFGPFAINNRQRRGEGKPETFNFLGFTHICVKKRSNGMYTVLRQTMRKRLQGRTALASRTVAAQPERARPLGSHAAPHRPLVAIAYRLSSLSPAPHGRHYLRQGADALCGLPIYVALSL